MAITTSVVSLISTHDKVHSIQPYGTHGKSVVFSGTLVSSTNKTDQNIVDSGVKIPKILSLQTTSQLIPQAYLIDSMSM